MIIEKADGEQVEKATVRRRRQPETFRLEDDPLWFKDAIIYELNVRAFKDSNEDGSGDFKGLIEKLPYLQDLGVNAIWLLPFYPSPLRDDGYDIADYADVNPLFGELGDVHRFIKEAHRRGMRTPPTSTRGSSARATPSRAAPIATSTSGARPTSAIRTPASSSRTSRSRTGRGTTLPEPTTGTASTLTSRT